MSGPKDVTPCYGCRNHVPAKDVWWRALRNGGSVTVCPICWSRATNTKGGQIETVREELLEYERVHKTRMF